MSSSIFPYWFGVACLAVSCQQRHLLFINLMLDRSVNRHPRQNELPGGCWEDESAAVQMSAVDEPYLYVIVPQEWFNNPINHFYLLIMLELNGLLPIFSNPNKHQNSSFSYSFLCECTVCTVNSIWFLLCIWFFFSYTVYFGAKTGKYCISNCSHRCTWLGGQFVPPEKDRATMLCMQLSMKTKLRRREALLRKTI